MNWADSRKRRFRRRASTAYTLAVGLTATSTVILGLQDLNVWADIAFGMVALSTAVNAFEPFFNWRSRWVLMEEAQYRLNRILDDIDYYTAIHRDEDMKKDDLKEFYSQFELVLADISDRWLEYRRVSRSDHARAT
jgi:hypothetical protein